MLNSTLNPILQTAIADVYDRLTRFAQDPLFTENMKLVFGGQGNIIPQRFLTFLPSLPKIEVRQSQEIGGAWGAFSAQTNTIYLSESLLTASQSNQLTAVLLEEIGHYLDSRLNKVDTKGDEGELFSAVVRGINLSPTELTRIQNENDQKQIVLDGKLLTVEQATAEYFPNLSPSTPQPLPWWGTGYQISGDNVVFSGDLLPWYQGRLHYNTDIFLWNRTNINFLYEIGSGYNDPYPPDFNFFAGNQDPNDYAPNISGDNIVWYTDDFNSTKLNFWDSKNNIAVEIASFVSNTGLPAQISGNNVVWVGNHAHRIYTDDGSDNYSLSNEIYFWNGSTTTQLTNNSTDDNTPKVSGNNVAWLGFDGNDYEVYFWNGSTTTQVTNNSTDDRQLQLSGNNVVWSGYDGNDYEIYLWNGKKTIQITNNSTDDSAPQISGDNIVWIGTNNYNSQVYFWDGSSITQISNNLTTQSNWEPQISGHNVIWAGYDSLSLKMKLYFWNGVTLTELASGNNTFHNPQISGNNTIIEFYSFDDIDSRPVFLTISNGGFTSTSQLDSINANDGNDAVFSSFADLQQSDSIDGSTGTDTLILSGGIATNSITVNAGNLTNQLIGITGTMIANFERFDLSNFAGSVNFIGSTSDDWIKSGLGADLLMGGLGNDTYIVDNIRDSVTENLNEGNDLVQSTVNTTLTNNVENLILLGTANLYGTGNNLDNTLTGNSGANLLKGVNGNDTLLGGGGNDTLIGGLGNDRLVGEGGADQFLFGSGSAFKSSNLGVDTLTDFTKNSDKIALSKVTFNALSSPLGTLQSAEFIQINSLSNELSLVGSSSAKIVYNVATGNLFYNPDGAITGLSNGGQFAILSNRPSLAATDFTVQT